MQTSAQSYLKGSNKSVWRVSFVVDSRRVVEVALDGREEAVARVALRNHAHVFASGPRSLFREAHLVAENKNE